MTEDPATSSSFFSVERPKLLNFSSQIQFLAKMFLWTRRMQLWWPSRLFLPKAGEWLARTQKLMENFFYSKESWSRRSQFVHPTKKKARNPKSFCWQTKNKKIDKYFENYLPNRIIWTRMIQFWQTYQKVFRSKPAPIIAWSPWMWSSDSKRKSLPKLFFGTRNT